MIGQVVPGGGGAWALGRFPGFARTAADGGSTRPQRSEGPGSGIEALLLFIGGLASFAPVLAVPPQFAVRNGFFVLLAWWLAALVLIVPRTLDRRGGALALAGLALVLSIVATHRLRDDTIVSLSIKARALEFDALLRRAAAAGEREPVVPALGIAPPRTLHAIELAEEASRWDNRCVARYYGVESVRRAP